MALVLSVLLIGAGFSAGAAAADPVCNPGLRAELVAMMAQDQYEQSPDYTGPWHGPQRTERLRRIIARYGWPTFRMVGVDGATAAWVIAQHSDHDPAFQQQALELMRAAAAAGQADPVELAYLEDRTAVNHGRLQIYGTQVTCVDGEVAPRPLIDPERVDERRASVGLGPIQEYLDSFPDDMCAETAAQTANHRWLRVPLRGARQFADVRDLR
jgi:hypothetical protein